jgi:hypothetical protein
MKLRGLSEIERFTLRLRLDRTESRHRRKQADHLIHSPSERLVVDGLPPAVKSHTE